MSNQEQIRPYTSPKASFLSFKSQTLNPETKQNEISFQFEEDKFIVMTASRAKRKLQQTSTTNRRKFSFSSNQLKQNNSIAFQPTQTISHMTRQRHNLEQQTKNLTNFYSYLSQRLHSKQSHQSQKKQKQQYLSQIFTQNKSQKNFFHKTIQKYNKKLYETKLISKSVVVNHRRKRHQMLKLTLEERANAGEIGRKQASSNEKCIMEMKKMEYLGKKDAVMKGRSYEEELLRIKMEREEMKKRVAQENYRKKWTHEFMQKQKVERQNMIRNRKLGRKIQTLLSQLQLQKHPTQTKQ